MEEAAQLLEHICNSSSTSAAYPSGNSNSAVSPDLVNKYWQSNPGTRRQDEKLALIREVVDSMPEVTVVQYLYKEVFVTRPQGALGNIVHTPTFLRQSSAFCDCLSLDFLDAQVASILNLFPMDQLACQLLAVSILTCFFISPY